MKNGGREVSREKGQEGFVKLLSLELGLRGRVSLAGEKKWMAKMESLSQDKRSGSCHVSRGREISSITNPLH